MRGKARNMNMKRQLEDKLPLELWTEVLARLPVKTLVRFRCVCKCWRSLIDNPAFISMNLTLSNNNRDKLQILSLESVTGMRVTQDLVLKTFRANNNFKKSEEIFKFTYSSFGFGSLGPSLDYVNGLMLLRSYRHNRDILMLWNPSIRKSLTLPPFPVGGHSYYILLGFDPTNNDYKVVAFYYCDQPRVAIYDLSKGYWRTKSIENSVYFSGNRVFSKGVVHCKTAYGNNLKLISFDCVSETWNYRDLPPIEEDGNQACERVFCRYLFLLGESLAVHEISKDNRECCIWVMAEENEGRQLWTKWYSSRDLWSGISFNSYSTRILYVDKSAMLFASNSKTVNSFDLESDQRKVLRNVESLVLSNGFECQRLTEALASLVSRNSM